MKAATFATMGATIVAGVKGLLVGTNEFTLVLKEGLKGAADVDGLNSFTAIFI